MTLLMDFHFDEEASEVMIRWNEPINGGHRDHTIYLNKGDKLGNLTYQALATEEYGVILWDNQKKTGEILKPDDPRWDKLLQKKTENPTP